MKEAHNQIPPEPPERGALPELTPEALHQTLTKTLLGMPYGPDAHYYHGAANYISEGGEPTTTPYRISDYHAADSEHWVFRFAVPYGSDEQEQKRLLQEGRGVIGIQTEAPTFDETIVYSVCRPTEIKPESTNGLTMHREPDFPEIPPPLELPVGWPEPPAEWPVEGPVVFEKPHREAAHIIDPATHPFLRAVYEDLHEQD
jgi:hypothetical protein